MDTRDFASQDPALNYEPLTLPTMHRLPHHPSLQPRVSSPVGHSLKQVQAYLVNPFSPADPVSTLT